MPKKTILLVSHRVGLNQNLVVIRLGIFNRH